MAGNIFINYRRDESGHVAGRLHDSLAPTFGRNKLFMDVDNIPVGRDFEDYLKSQVAACDAMLAVIGPNWLAAKDDTGKRRLDNPDDFIVIEIGTALTRNIPVVPVLVDGARMPKASELPDSLKLLARCQAMQVRHTSFSSDAFNEAIRLNPTHANALHNRGIAYGRKGEHDRAIADYNEAIRLDPKDATAFCIRERSKLRINDSSGNADIAKARELDASVCK